MKPKIAPTSPKYAVDHPVAKLYATDQSKLQQPARGLGWGIQLILVIIIGVIAGAGGMVGANNLYHHHSGWPIWQWVGFSLSGESGREVIIRETAPVDKNGSDREAIFKQVSGALVSLYLAPVDPKNSDKIGKPLLADSYRGTGLIVTNDGVVAFDSSISADAEEKLVAVTSDGIVHPLSLVVRDPLSSLGLGRIEGKQFSIAAFGVEADLTVGQSLFEVEVDALRGQPLYYERTLIARSVRPDDQRGSSESSDAITRYPRIESPNNTVVGGAIVIDQRGSVVGMRLKSLSPQLVFSVEHIRSALESFTAHQEIERSKFGVFSYDLRTTPGLSAEATGEHKDGALLVTASVDEPAVVPGGPAGNAGLQAGDLILSVDNKQIDATHFLSDLVQSFEVGRTVSVRYVRAGTELSASLTVGKYQ